MCDKRALARNPQFEDGVNVKAGRTRTLFISLSMVIAAVCIVTAVFAIQGKWQDREFDSVPEPLNKLLPEYFVEPPNYVEWILKKVRRPYQSPPPNRGTW